MATLSVSNYGYHAADEYVPISSFSVFIASGSVIGLTYQNFQLYFYGSFFYNAAGTALAGGTVTSYGQYEDNIYLGGGTGWSLPALTVQSYIQANDWAGLNAYALSGNDTFFGNTVEVVTDTIRGYAGNDTMYGYNGDDLLYGSEGSDTLYGGNGNDLLDSGPGNDFLDGGAGNDMFIVDSTGDTITDSSGYDTVQAYVPWSLVAGLENLTLIGSASYGAGNSADNNIVGNDSSNPLLRGDGGSDVILGRAGNDWIEGDSYVNDALSGNDYIQGDDGDDTILGGPGDDTVHGGNGTDTIVGDAGNDLLYGNAGIDYLDGRGGSDQLFSGDGNDIIFGDGYPSIYGFSSDTIHGDAGDDILMGESGDHAAGGALDVIYGDTGNDIIYGGSGNDWIYGGDGNDVIDGGDGSDFIVGGPGADIMVGSGDSSAAGGPPATSGGDLFSYGSLADGGDRIYGFDTNMGTANDAIDLRSIFDSTGYAGTNPRADGHMYVFQNGPNADIYIDADGLSGGVNLTLLATLHNLTATTLTDNYFLFQ